MKVTDQTSAKARVFTVDDARALLKGIDRIVSARGKKVVTLDLAPKRPAWKEIAPLLLGPTGNLRAPTMRKETTLFVGFSETGYRELLS